MVGSDRVGDVGSVGFVSVVFDTMLPDATQIADPFHVVKLANFVLDELRRRVRNETCGHRGRKTDPLYRSRKLMTIDLQDDSCPPELRRLGRTITKWRLPIAAWHQAKFTNGPTEAVNNLIKRVKRVAFGITNRTNYRTRQLLYAGNQTGRSSTPTHAAIRSTASGR